MKKNILFILVLIVMFITTIGIIVHFTNNDSKESGKIEIIATLFPQYDFAKQIGGDKVNVTLLLPPGTESHSYEPTPKDMANINNSSLFIYTGKEMEPWAEELISGVKNNIKVLDLSTTVTLINSEEFEEKHESNEIEKSKENIEENKIQSSINSNKTHDKESEHSHSYDPHIWLNPQYAIKMVESIKEQLCQIDPKNSDYYKSNAKDYIQKIAKLDSEFEQTVSLSSNKKIAFGGAFAYAYFIERYNLEFITAYEACGENIEPSTMQVKNVIDYINKYNLPVVFYKEYTNGSIAKTISENTNAKMLVFNTVHNVSKSEIENGASYVSIMNENLKNLKTALSY